MIPFKQNYPGVSRLNKKEKGLFNQTLSDRAQKVTDDLFIKSSWENFILSKKANYLSVAFGHNLYLARIIKKLGMSDYLISNKVALVVLNFLRSRVHRESFISILEHKIKKER